MYLNKITWHFEFEQQFRHFEKIINNPTFGLCIFALQSQFHQETLTLTEIKYNTEKSMLHSSQTKHILDSLTMLTGTKYLRMARSTSMKNNIFKRPSA